METIKLNKGNRSKAVLSAKKVLEKDGLVVIPSDTVYVLAAKANSSSAIRKVLDFKGRRPERGVSVFVKNTGEINKYARFSQDQAEIINTLLPGCFTIILGSKGNLASELEPGDGTLGIRVVENEFVHLLLRTVNFPITATSANISGKGPHYSVPSFLNTLSGKKRQVLDLVIDAGKLPRVPTSTVVRLTKAKIEILRKGFLNPRLISKQETTSAQASKKFAQRIYRRSIVPQLKNRAVVVILRGDLGVGKTVLAKGIGELFGQQFVSPTFVLLDEYPINQPPAKTIYHLDLYRLENELEIKQLRLEQFLQPGNLMLIEWGEKLATFQELKKQGAAFFLLQIEDQGNNKRQLKLYKV